MKRIIYFAFVFAILNVDSYIIKVPTVLPNERTAPVAVGRVHIQKLLLPLLEDVCEESSEPIVVRLSEEFQLNPKDSNYIDPTAIDNFIALKSSKGLLRKGEIFSEYDEDHMNELRIIYKLLINAENFDTFYKAACWARQNVNCGIFVDAIYSAIMRRRDTERVLLPALYEVLPNYFVRKDYIIKASTLISGTDSPLVDVRNDGNSYIIDVNYTDNYFDNGIEQMTYFNEDVDLNSYYFFNKLKMLKWFSDDIANINSRRGQYFFQMIKQLNTRYNLERYSIGLPEIESIDWDTNNECIYEPMLIFSNGNDFDKRPSTTSLNDENILTLKNIENNILTTISQMKAAGTDRVEIYNYLVKTLVTNDDSYENIAMKILSNINLQIRSTSVLGHYMTTLRDPIYWRLNSKIVEIVDNALKVLPPYEINELYFPGVEVTNIDIKKPSTSCDDYEFDVTDALRNKEVETKFQIKFNQQRLTNKPLSIKISISSLVTEKALIKIYIGPKLLPGQFIESKNWFMQLDSFETNLKIGTNTITRTSNQMNNLSDGFVSFEKIRKYIQDAEFGIDALPIRTIDSQTGFPSRLILPRGSSAPFQLFIFVAPFVKAIAGGARNYMQSNYDAILSPGYPMDLNIEIQNLFDLPNALVKDIVITHKSATPPHASDTNGNSDWQNDYTEYKNNPSKLASSYAKSSYSSNKFDYKSKSEKYGTNNKDTKPKPINNYIVTEYDIESKLKNKNTDNVVTKQEVTGNLNNTENKDAILVKIDGIINDNYLVDKNDEQENKDIFLIKHIDTNNDETGRVITIDKNINNDYSKDTYYDGKVIGGSDNVVVKHIESKDDKYSKSNDELGTKFDYGRAVTIDKNINNDFSKDMNSDNTIVKHIESKGGKIVSNKNGTDSDYEKNIAIDKKINFDYKIEHELKGNFDKVDTEKNNDLLTNSNKPKLFFSDLS